MSLDRSLKSSGTMAANRSVLKRNERIDKMVADKKFDTSKDRPLGLPKTRVSKK
jgi:small basic protein (TIGR04137 family)